MFNNSSLKWIECDGGPHIMIQKSFIGLWEGIGNPKHYKAACDIEDYIGLLPIGSR